jgi:hypothetical protein
MLFALWMLETHCEEYRSMVMLATWFRFVLEKDPTNDIPGLQTVFEQFRFSKFGLSYAASLNKLAAIALMGKPRNVVTQYRPVRR